MPQRPPAHALPDPVPSKLLCLDIETVPDAALMPADWPKDRFPKAAWHRVVAVAFAVARIDVDPATGMERYVLESCRSGGEPGWDEASLVRGFWQFFSRDSYRLVSWNGRAFDMQVLLLRAFLHGIPTGAYFLRGTRWSGYTHRYAPDYHSDLMELLSGYGAATRMGLDEMAVAMGLPGKAGEHGSNVESLVMEGRIERVRNYCECDVLNTVALYIRWSLLSGRSDAEGHDAGMTGVAEYLRREGDRRPHLAEFLHRWMASDRPAPMKVVRSPAVMP